jgi:hypothetical protein
LTYSRQTAEWSVCTNGEFVTRALFVNMGRYLGLRKCVALPGHREPGRSGFQKRRFPGVIGSSTPYAVHSLGAIPYRIGGRRFLIKDDQDTSISRVIVVV